MPKQYVASRNGVTAVAYTQNAADTLLERELRRRADREFRLLNGGFSTTAMADFHAACDASRAEQKA